MPVLAAAAAACVSGAPAPISYGGSPARAASAASAPASSTAPAGPLSGYGLQPQSSQPFAPGDMPRTHRVAEGETLYDIAARYRIPLLALRDANRLGASEGVRPGRVLTLPRHRVHVAAPGESLRDVAAAYDVDPRSLALLNRLALAARLNAGDRIYLPFPGDAADIEMAASAPAPAPASSSAPFQRPLPGALVVRYGEQEAGGRSDGVEIGGEEGESVIAAAEGEVVYSGEDLPAYGALVLVRHAGDLVTTYGYLRRSLVRVGQRVRAGEAIGELGARPDGGARLLFQVRRHGRPEDPEPLMAGG